MLNFPYPLVWQGEIILTETFLTEVWSGANNNYYFFYTCMQNPRLRTVYRQRKIERLIERKMR